ncbi:MAG: GGDEF domain-containing protein [Pseudobutyrivibrio sp.]|nr:GGDEF domain-containing protein [Pseudobutyrivibrio sp.]
MIGGSFVFDGATYMAALIGVSMLLFITSMRSFDYILRQKFIFIFTILLIALASVTADEYLQEMGNTVALRYVTRIVKFICEGFLEMEALMIIDTNRTKKKTILYSIPFIVASIIKCLAPLSDKIFYFDANNQYTRGILGNVIFIEGAIYAILILLISAKKWRDGYTRDAFIMTVITFMIFIGVALEEKKIVYNGTLCTSALGLVFIYIYIYAERYNVDSVSKCYKRRCFYSDASKYSKTNLAIISMDLNDLKYINDNFGHKAGDIALLTFAEVVRSVKTNKFILYRTGGDEFMILGIRASREEAEELVEAIRNRLDDTPYSSSYGIAMYKPGDDFDEVVVRADKAMYTEKRDFKENSTKRRRSREDDYEKLETFTKSIVSE